MTFPISFVKAAARDTNLNPVVDYIDDTQQIRHDTDRGATEGTQMFLVKTLGGAGDTAIKLTPNNGQSLIAAFSFSQAALLSWVSSDGAIVSGLGIHAISGANFTKLIENDAKDQYVWFGVAELGDVGKAATHPAYTYTVEYSGNYTSPEAILKSTGIPGPLPTGLYSNPGIIGPNSSGTYNSTYGDCISGSYYLSFQVIGNIVRNLNITTEDSSEFGVVVATSKDEVKNWVLNNGSGTLTNGGNYLSSGGSVTIDVLLTTTQDVYAIFYNPSDIGGTSCVGGKAFTVISTQETESGSSNGTYANPYFVGNNEPVDYAQDRNRSSGECTVGASYFKINSCSDTNIDITVSSYDMPLIGLAVASSKSILADFIRTGNTSSLTAIVENDTQVSVQFYSTTYEYYAIVYDPNNRNTSSCGSSETFRLGTRQLNCGGGGSGRDGRYNNPYEGSYWGNIIHADGDADVNGRIWFHSSGFGCYTAPINISISPENYQNIGVAWSTNQSAIETFLNGGGTGSGSGGGGGGNCGYFTDPGSYPWTAYYDFVGNYYYPVGYEEWYSDDTGNTYYGPNQLPDYCGGGGGGGGGGGSEINDLNSVSYMTGTSWLEASIPNPNQYSDIYLAVYLPDSDPATQVDNFNSFNLSVGAYYCEYFGGDGSGLPSGLNSDPFVISNNMSPKYIPYATGECESGNFYMQGYICQSNMFSFTTSTDNPSTLAWSNNLGALITWRNNGMAGTPEDYGATDAGVSNNEYSPSLQFVPDATGLYYFLLTSGTNTCTNFSTFSISTQQGECDGSNIGTYAAPVGISNGDNIVMSLSDGACFDNRIYYATQLCADTSASLVITPSSYSHRQAYMYGPDLAFLKNNVNMLYGGNGYYYVPGGGQKVDIYDANPITVNIPASNTIRNMYVVTFEYPQGGYSNTVIPRCGVTDTVTLQFNQNCPIVDIGGSQGISGANVYSIDPYGPSGNKTGIALVEGDPARNYDASLMYSPMIILDQASSYPAITCSSINATLYVNKLNGYTEVVQTKSTSAAKVIYDNVADTALIKPMVGSELIFTNASFYTGLIRTTFVTNVGTFVRNQVINAGSTFTGGREQYSYVIASSGANLTIAIPVIDEFVHTLVTSGGNISPTYTMDKYNTVKVTMTPQLPLNSVLTIPFKTANSDVVRTAKVIVK
jgi:hypothetical protein